MNKVILSIVRSVLRKKICILGKQKLTTESGYDNQFGISMDFWDWELRLNVEGGIETHPLSFYVILPLIWAFVSCFQEKI